MFDFQNTRFKLAECATLAHVARSFYNDCVQRLLDGKLEREAAYVAKWWCSEPQCKVLDVLLQTKIELVGRVGLEPTTKGL